ncbi:MAG TPA: hypothetical protein VGP15_02550, partial [Burkholderiales bacterium]|nr:hypothetical protein [Burkholderiales bacterium]
RLGNPMMDTLVKLLTTGKAMTLNLVELERTTWWQFWKRAPATQPLSTHASAVPQAELALLEALLKKSTRREKPLARDDVDHGQDRSPDSGRSAASTSTGPEAFAGKGGQGGGGGASGSWADAPPASGVDSAGRIVAVAAGAAALAAAATMAAAAAEAGTSGAGAIAPDSGGDPTGGTAY